jgi:hypothetical protein
MVPPPLFQLLCLTAGAAVDSVLFPTIAFGVLMPEIVILQFAAKVIGGGFWSYIFKKYDVSTLRV